MPEEDLAGAVNTVLNLLGLNQTEAIQKQVLQLYADLQGVTLVLARFLIAVLWWAAHIASANSDALGYSQLIDDALKRFDSDYRETWTTWLNVKYPADLRALYAELLGKASKQNSADLTAIRKELARHKAEIAALDKWQTDKVNPMLKQWTGFYAVWKTKYLPPITTLTRWLHSPKTFASWALPSLIAGTYSVISQPEYKQSASSIELVLVRTWANNPERVYDAVLTWLVTDS